MAWHHWISSVYFHNSDTLLLQCASNQICIKCQIKTNAVQLRTQRHTSIQSQTQLMHVVRVVHILLHIAMSPLDSSYLLLDTTSWMEVCFVRKSVTRQFFTAWLHSAPYLLQKKGCIETTSNHFLQVIHSSSLLFRRMKLIVWSVARVQGPHRCLAKNELRYTLHAVHI